MTVIEQIVDAIQRHPHIDRIIVSAAERKAMNEEYVDLLPGGPLSDAERRAWLSQAWCGSFHIMGRPVLTQEEHA